MRRARPNLRRRILDAALDLLEKDHADGLSIREVARRAGTTHQAPYHYFEDRGAILATLAEEGFIRLGDALIAARDSGPGQPEKQLTGCGAVYFNFGVAHPRLFELMFKRETYDPPRETLRAAATRAFEVLVGCIIAAQAAGKAPAGNPMPLVVMGWATAHGLATLASQGALTRGPVDLGLDLESIGALVARTVAAILASAGKR